MNINGSQIVLKILAEQGVDTVFGYPGGTILNIYDALYNNPYRIRHILTAHEQGAAHAADGYARATGKTGVVFATSGPGSTNLVTGIATAYMDSIPMVAITANVPKSLIGADSFQEIYIAGVTMPITKHNMVVRTIEELAPTLRKAFAIAAYGRPGPVLVDITKDVTADCCEFVPAPHMHQGRGGNVDIQQIKKAARMINAAKRPVIHFGGGAVNASQVLHKLIHKANIPACHTIMGSGTIAFDDELNMGMIGMHGNISSGIAVKEADVLVVVGARFSDRVATRPDSFAPNADIIHIDIDAAERNKNISASCFVSGDANEILSLMLPMIEANTHCEWIKAINEWRKNDVKHIAGGKKFSPFDIMNIISQQLGCEAIIVTDVGQHQMWAAQYCRRTKPRSFLTSGGLGTMGFGYGAACGAQTAFPKRRVVHITGDGCFHMNLNELCTAVSYKLPIITVIMNNGVLGMVRQWQTMFYKRRYSQTDPKRETDFAAVAEAFGARGFRADTAIEFENCLKEAVSSGAPCVIDCKIDKDEMVMPMIAGGDTVDNAYRSASDIRVI